MQQPTAHSLLATWEQGRHRHPLDRGLLLYALAVPEAPHDSLADRPLGQRNSALLRLRRALFGDGLNACVDCPACGEKLEFAISVGALLAEAGGGSTWVEVDGLTFRLPTTRDLARLASAGKSTNPDEDLLGALLVSDASLDEPAALALSPRVAAALEAADPQSDFVLNQHCPPCGHSWAASLDVVSFVWEEIEARARRLLDEVHLLASAYGWSEREILSLTEPRRAAYLERVLA